MKNNIHSIYPTWICPLLFVFLTNSISNALRAVPSATVVPTVRTTQSFHQLSPQYSFKIQSSSFFGIGATKRSLQLTPTSNGIRFSTVPQHTEPNDAEFRSNNIDELKSAEIPLSILESIDRIGMKLKTWAISSRDKSDQIRFSNLDGANINGNSRKGRKFKWMRHSLQSNILWMLYILYRGYRGFFVILPAVFREVFRQLHESNLVVDAFDDEIDQEVFDPSDNLQRPMRLRTRVTVSVLSTILTLSYVVSGALRVLGKFIKTLTTTSSVESSLHAAADEVELNENKLLRRHD